MTWSKFDRYFREMQMCKRYYDGKIKEFHEHKLRNITMEEYANRFIEMLSYANYIRDGNIKI